MKVLILIEAERDANTPHPEVGTPLPEGWAVLPVDSNLWLTPDQRIQCQTLLKDAATIIRAAMGQNGRA